MANFSKRGDLRKLKILIIKERKRAGLKQGKLAKRLGLQQSLVSRLERGPRDIGVCEFFVLAPAIGFDPYPVLRQVFGGGDSRAGARAANIRPAITVTQASISRVIAAVRKEGLHVLCIHPDGSVVVGETPVNSSDVARVAPTKADADSVWSIVKA